MALALTKEQFISTFSEIWKRSNFIFFEVMTREALFTRPIELRNPLIFYLGHFAGFNYIQINLRVLGDKSFNPVFDAIFERGIDPDVDDPTKCHSHSEIPKQWPDLSLIQTYVERAHEAVLESYERISQAAHSNKFAAKGAVYHLSMEHELMHQETFFYMYQQLDKKYKIKPDGIPPYRLGSAARSKKSIQISAGSVTLGASPDELEFGWDNEFPKHVVDVPAFLADDLNVTNGEFLEFVQSGEYDDRRHWRADDWTWKLKTGLNHPVFWKKSPEGRWYFIGVFGEELEMEKVSGWPVLVSWAEATAYANWKGRSLPTEAQWQRCAFSSPSGEADGMKAFPWGNTAPTEDHGNFDWKNFGLTPVGTHPKSASAWGVEDLIGDAWEWTSTPFGPYPGFEKMENYPGYSSDFFDGKHYVLKGASWATALKLVRRSFRNWYQDRYPFMFAKFRLVSN